MKLSCHTIILDNYPNVGEYLVYHTRTQAMVKIDRDLKDVLDHLGQNGNTFNPRHNVHLEQLRQMGIVARDEQEDFVKLKSHLHQLKYGYDKSFYGVTILTTYGCNLGCVYCFQENTRSTVKMNPRIQEQVLGWLKRRMERLGYQRIYINYYGGEPLLNPGAIECISSEMKKWCASKGLGFSFGIQTNGYLLTLPKVEEFKKIGLRRVRVSLDGVKEDHDRSRPLRGGGGSFDRIIKNIIDCAGKIEIAISMGYRDNDLRPVERLLDYLDDLGILDKLGGQFLFSPVIPTVGPKGDAGAIRAPECMRYAQDDKLAEAARKVADLMKRKGLPNKSGMATATCPLVRENSSVTIDQEGLLYRCNPLLGHPEFSVGDVSHDEYNETHKEFRDLDVWKQCPTDCTYLPMCSGGCRLMSFVGGNKDFKGVSCKKSYLDEMAPEFIKRDYERMVAQKQETANREKKVVMV